MKSTTLARLLLLVLIAGAFAFGGWRLMQSAPTSKRERPPAPVPLVDVVDSTPGTHPLTLLASGPVSSALELEIRPQVGGRIVALHPDFEPGGRIAAGSRILQIERRDYELAVAAAKAEIAKANAAIAIEQGRRRVAREELESLNGTLRVDPTSRALALRKPQLRQVQAELTAARNLLQRAELDLSRTELTLPFDVVVLERTRVTDEVVAARELVGRVARADEYWVDLKTLPDQVGYLSARTADTPGSPVIVRYGGQAFAGEIVRIRADLASASRMASVIASVPVDPTTADRLLLGSYVQARINAGALSEVMAIPRRALRDNDRVWVVDRTDRLQVRQADIAWASGQQLLLRGSTLEPGDRIVVSRVSGLLPDMQVRSRRIDLETGRTLDAQTDIAGNVRP